MVEISEEVRKAAEKACKPNTALAVTLVAKETVQDAILGGAVGAAAGAAVGTITGPGMVATSAMGAAGGMIAGGATGLLFGIQDVTKPDPDCVKEHLRPLNTPKEAMPEDSSRSIR